MPWSPPQSRRARQWNAETAGPVSRWFLVHVHQVPAGLARFSGFVVMVLGLGMGVLSIYLWNDPSALQSDREFFPFISVFFLLIGGVLVLASALVRRRVRRRRANAPPPEQPPGPWAGPANPRRLDPTRQPDQHHQPGQFHPGQHHR